jgi:hypothetical protein
MKHRIFRNLASEMTRRYDLQPLEDEYRNFTGKGDFSALSRLNNLLATIRYDLRMDDDVIIEYRSGFDEPMVMRIIKNEKDFDRWVEQRFVRLSEVE